MAIELRHHHRWKGGGRTNTTVITRDQQRLFLTHIFPNNNPIRNRVLRRTSTSCWGHSYWDICISSSERDPIVAIAHDFQIHVNDGPANNSVTIYNVSRLCKYAVLTYMHILLWNKEWVVLNTQRMIPSQKILKTRKMMSLVCLNHQDSQKYFQWCPFSFQSTSQYSQSLILHSLLDYVSLPIGVEYSNWRWLVLSRNKLANRTPLYPALYPLSPQPKRWL